MITSMAASSSSFLSFWLFACIICVAPYGCLAYVVFNDEFSPSPSFSSSFLGRSGTSLPTPSETITTPTTIKRTESATTPGGAGPITTTAVHPPPSASGGNCDYCSIAYVSEQGPWNSVGNPTIIVMIDNSTNSTRTMTTQESPIITSNFNGFEFVRKDGPTDIFQTGSSTLTTVQLEERVQLYVGLSESYVSTHNSSGALRTTAACKESTISYTNVVVAPLSADFPEIAFISDVDLASCTIRQLRLKPPAFLVPASGLLPTVTSYGPIEAGSPAGPTPPPSKPNPPSSNGLNEKQPVGHIEGSIVLLPTIVTPATFPNGLPYPLSTIVGTEAGTELGPNTNPSSNPTIVAQTVSLGNTQNTAVATPTKSQPTRDSLPPLTAGGTTILPNSATAYAIGSQTFIPGVPAVTASSGAPAAIASSASIVAKGGSTATLLLPLIIGSATVLPNGASAYIIGSQTLVPGAGAPAAIPPSASTVVKGGRTAVPLPPLTIGGTLVLPNSASAYVIGSQTLVPGAPAKTVPGTPPSASVIIKGGGTTALPALSTQLLPLTIGSKPIFPKGASGYIIGSQTLRPGGPAITVSGTPLSLPPPAPPATSPFPLPVLQIASKTILPNSRSEYIIGDQTLVSALLATSPVSGTPISLAPSVSDTPKIMNPTVLVSRMPTGSSPAAGGAANPSTPIEGVASRSGGHNCLLTVCAVVFIFSAW